MYIGFHGQLKDRCSTIIIESPSGVPRRKIEFMEYFSSFECRFRHAVIVFIRLFFVCFYFSKHSHVWSSTNWIAHLKQIIKYFENVQRFRRYTCKSVNTRYEYFQQCLFIKNLLIQYANWMILLELKNND